MKRLWFFLYLVPLICVVVVSTSTASSQHQHGCHYEFPGSIKNIAIIGAGVGGLVSYREFVREGFNVRLFDRDDMPGGNWHYTEQIPLPAHYSYVPTEVADYVPDLPPKSVELPYEEEYDNEPLSGLTYEQRLQEHRGPKPIWESLYSNAPAPIQQITEFPWPLGTAWESSQRALTNYLRAFASWHGVNSNDNNPNVSYNTRVEDARKISIPHPGESGKRENWEGWRLTFRKLSLIGKGRYKLTWWTEDFDAVVVATGRYNAASVPSIRGMEAWAQTWPESLHHSREYRRPDFLRNKTLLIVGAATSGSEISREASRYAKKIYQSVRPHKNNTDSPFRYDYLLRRIPANVSIVPEIAQFRNPAPGSSITSAEVELKNGTVLAGIDHIIFATGFIYTFPFLPQYHNSSLKANETAEGAQPLVTDGSHVRSLHFDMLYIEEPTLGFINLNLGMQSFIWCEFAALALSHVWAGKAHPPSRDEMWKLYWKRVKERGGHTKNFQFVPAKQAEQNMRFFVGWLNKAASKHGGRLIQAPPAEQAEIRRFWNQARYGGQPDDRYTPYSQQAETTFEQDNAVLNNWWYGG